MVEIDVLDPNGQRVGDETVFVNNLRPGERSMEESFIFDTAGGVTCVIARVMRLPSRPLDEPIRVECSVADELASGSVSVALTVQNSAAVMADFAIEAALVRDGVRIGTARASIPDVGPGESGSGVAESNVSGPADVITCEAVSVERLPSD